MKMKRLNYTFDDNGISGVDVGFEEWGNPDLNYNITVRLTAEDTDLGTATPPQLAEVAKLKIAELLGLGSESE